MSKFVEMLSNWKTTIVGIVPLIVGLLVAFGFISVNPQEVAEGVSNTFDSIVALVSSALGLGLLFSKDADK